jgi:formamidopyrimidine-DNA glycosylase
MPELPEVEYAATVARTVAVGRLITRVRVLHPALRRSLRAEAVRRLAGDRIVAIDRRGKYQLFRLKSGRTLLVHFRMTGDWEVHRGRGQLPASVRAVIEFGRGPSLLLVDSRALATLSLHEPDSDPVRALGPEANDPLFNARWLAERLASRRGPIKPALLDQSLVAGIGNIYAVEALWLARLDPRRPANRLKPAELRALVSGVRRSIARALAHPERYYQPEDSRDGARFNVYDREGLVCRRCGAPIRRIVQAGRSTYFCEGCQG